MVFGKICGRRSPNASTYATSTSSTVRPRATPISVSCVTFFAEERDRILLRISLVNLDSHLGACGFFSIIIPGALGSLLVRFDPDTMEPLRDETSQLCIPCKTGERGLLLGMIRKTLFNAFDGYVNNPSGNNRKIVENVYRLGDRAFNTGSVESTSANVSSFSSAQVM